MNMKKQINLALIALFTMTTHAQDLGVKVEDSKLREAHQANISSLAVKVTNDLRDVANHKRELDVLEAALSEAKKDAGGKWKIHLSQEDLQRNSIAGASVVSGILVASATFESKILKSKLRTTGALGLLVASSLFTLDNVYAHGPEGEGILFSATNEQIEEIRSQIKENRKNLDLVEDRLELVQDEIKAEVNHVQRQRVLANTAEAEGYVDEARVQEALEGEADYKKKFDPKHSQKW